MLVQSEFRVNNLLWFTYTYLLFPFRFVGYYEFMRGIVMIKDIELIKKICIKDFDHFQDHRQLMKSDGSMFTRHLFALRGKQPTKHNYKFLNKNCLDRGGGGVGSTWRFFKL